MTELGITRQFPPVEWESAPLIDGSHLDSTFLMSEHEFLPETRAAR
jgi:hypothetical protein